MAAILGAGALTTQSEAALSAKDRRGIIERISRELREKYVFPDLAEKMEIHVKKQMTEGRYDSTSEAAVFAEALTADLRSVSRDLHLRITYRPAVRQRANGRAPRTPIGDRRILEGNIGYLKVNVFAPEMNPAISDAMKSLSSTDALIIDVRDNPGGSPASVMFLAGYFFDRPTMVAHIYSRPDNTTTEMWTERVPGPLYVGKNVYILTNKRTFSAAEACAYHLKHVRKAKIVGEVSGGGAHRISTVDIGHGLVMQVPITRPINVVTGGDWEGTGVAVDLQATDDKAMATAHLDAMRQLPANAERERIIAQLRQTLGRIE